MLFNFFERHYKISLLITSIILIIIFSLSSISFEFTPGSQKAISVYSVVYHFFAYFFLELFILFSIIKGKYKFLIPTAIVFAIIFGFLDEIHQYFIPGRDSSFFDIFVDCAGILSSSLVYILSFNKNSNI
ncbi:hypothetical protein COU54_02915 [Candidatus Pacearchaeota archaeon CG10_big_fil_rev_8_21_14_0_10_31_24]|nr:MAG: hypothetical protein COU54_02915 [Candidatus Pacearchaeota archaeon CG10_big_fil_rev_8_21_14_0_10_31_24]